MRTPGGPRDVTIAQPPGRTSTAPVTSGTTGTSRLTTVATGSVRLTTQLRSSGVPVPGATCRTPVEMLVMTAWVPVRLPQIVYVASQPRFTGTLSGVAAVHPWAIAGVGDGGRGEYDGNAGGW